MDATSRPLYIPPQMGLYAEKHQLYQLMQGMLEGLLVHKPDEPIDFLIKQLKLDNYTVPRILILGPPASGKTTIAMWLCKQLLTPRISRETLLNTEWSSLAVKAQEYRDSQQNIPDVLWAELVEERLKIEDCIHNRLPHLEMDVLNRWKVKAGLLFQIGWVMEGLPETRELTRIFQEMGIIPRHVVVLHAPDTVLIERNLGKRVDVVTGEIYHTTFDWPSDELVRLNLEAPPDISEMETSERLLEYHRNYPGILQSFGKIMKLVNADQPCADVFLQVLTHVQFPPRTPAPFSPRILLCGPPGSGKSLQAALLVQKYGIINVCCGQLLKEAVANDTKLGELIKPFFDSGWPVADNIVLKLLSQRLNQLDCHIRGWVLHGFPRDQDQAKLMRQAEIHPSRVFFLTVTTQTILERLCYRKMDPVTGERYHSLYKPAATKETNDRLLMHPRDMEEIVMFKLDAYFRLSSSLENYFEEAVFINGDQDPQTVFEYIESYVVNPLPTKY